MNIDLENHVNPFSLTGARCRIRSKTARASPLRTAAAHGGAPGDDHLGMRLRSAAGAAALDPDDFFAEIGVTAPKFSETGRKQHLIRGPTPVSTVLPEKQFLGVVDSNNRGRASGAASGATQGGRPSVHAPGRPEGRYDRTARRARDDTPTVQEAFLTEPSIPDAVARHGALARASSARALESIIERSLGRAASPSAAAPALAGPPAAPPAPTPAPTSAPAPTPAPTTAAPAPAPRQPASAFRREVLAETRARFSAAEAQVQLTRMQALASKSRDAERARFERQLCAEARRREGVERDVDVCGAQLEAARQEAASLRHAFRLLARRQAFEHVLLLRCEEALQRHADAQPLVALLGEAFLHVPPEEVVQKYEALEAGYLQAHRASETLLLAARRLEGELADARDDGRAQTHRVSEQLTRKLAAADARCQALQAENDRLRESVALTQDSQAKYLQLSYAVAEMWNRWTDAKTLGGSVAALASARVGGKGADRGPDRGNLHPNLSEPLQVIRSMNTLLAVCFPQADASGEAFRRIATLANHAWTRLFVFPEAGRGAGDGGRAAGEGGLKDYDHLRGDPYKILEECVRRAEQAHADRQGAAGRAARTAAENKMLREDVERLTARLRQVENALRRWEGKAGLAPR